MIPYGMSASAWARALDVPVNRVTGEQGMHINEAVPPRAAIRRLDRSCRDRR
jgi:hypothetical protein